MMPSAYLEHQIPGRVRLRIPSRRGDGAFFDAARQGLSGTIAVEEVSANPHTASLLIRFCGDLDTLEAEAAQCGIFSLQREKPVEVVAKPVVGAKAEARADSVTPAELGLTGLAFYQVTRGKSLGSASEIFWNAYGANRVLERPGLALLLCGLGVWQMLRGEWLGPASALLFYALVARKFSEADPAAVREREPGPR